MGTTATEVASRTNLLLNKGFASKDIVSCHFKEIQGREFRSWKSVLWKTPAQMDKETLKTVV